MHPLFTKNFVWIKTHIDSAMANVLSGFSSLRHSLDSLVQSFTAKNHHSAYTESTHSHSLQIPMVAPLRELLSQNSNNVQQTPKKVVVTYLNHMSCSD